MALQYPLPNALVIVIRSDKRWAFYGYTDENGRIEITLPPGKYDIWVFKEKYSLHHQVEVIDRDKVKTITLEKKVFVERIVDVEYLATYAPWETMEAFLKVITERPHYWQEMKELEEEIIEQATPKIINLYIYFMYTWVIRPEIEQEVYYEAIFESEVISVDPADEITATVSIEQTS